MNSNLFNTIIPLTIVIVAFNSVSLPPNAESARVTLELFGLREERHFSIFDVYKDKDRVAW